MKRNAKSNKGSFIEIPPGDSRKHKPEQSDSSYPTMKYYQKEGEPTCLIISVANLLHHSGAKEHALFLFNDQKKIIRQANVWSCIKEKLRQLSILLIFQPITINSIETLQQDNSLPLITCLKGSDFKKDHTVVIYKNWIYDGNFKTALPLSVESLNECCSTENKKCKFTGFTNSYVISEYDAYLEQLKRSFHQTKPSKKQKRVK